MDAAEVTYRLQARKADFERKIVPMPGEPEPTGWMSYRNLLRHALVGLHERLPEAASILNCATSGQAFRVASLARGEIERGLSKLNSEHHDQGDEQP
jgi:hypothetical protein